MHFISQMLTLQEGHKNAFFKINNKLTNIIKTKLQSKTKSSCWFISLLGNNLTLILRQRLLAIRQRFQDNRGNFTIILLFVTCNSNVDFSQIWLLRAIISQIWLFEGDNFPHKKLFPQSQNMRATTSKFGCYRPHFQGNNPRKTLPLGWITGGYPSKI